MLDSILASGLTLPAFLVCTAVSLVLGIATAFLSMYRSKCSQGFAVTVAVLPAIVQIVILLVNGNVGAGVAVAGAFSLVRFRSVPGTAREIGVIFLAMALGLATGMGYVALAAVFFVIIAAVLLLLTRLDFGTRRTDERLLKITIPENLDYDGLFDDLLAPTPPRTRSSASRPPTWARSTSCSTALRCVTRRCPRPFSMLCAAATAT